MISGRRHGAAAGSETSEPDDTFVVAPSNNNDTARQSIENENAPDREDRGILY